MRVICKSGIEGWQGKLKSNYKNFKEFKSFCDIYCISERLGFETPEEAWKTNPTIQCSVQPDDLRIINS